MPKDKSSRCFSKTRSHDLFYKPYQRAAAAAAKAEAAEWDDVTCPICMESPHNAVLLRCSSHGKGCRAYMCDTSYRHSNCLDQYINAQSKADASCEASLEGVEGDEAAHEKRGRFVRARKGLNLVCPLCRGSVAGWEIVEAARNKLNSKSRSCAQDSCVFSGVYEELRKHARYVHPFARPSEIDPVREMHWRRLERERELGDVLSTMPNATVFGDYVIEEGDEDDEELEDDESDDEQHQQQQQQLHRHHQAHQLQQQAHQQQHEQQHRHHQQSDTWTMLLLFQILDPSGGSSNGEAAIHQRSSRNSRSSETRHSSYRSGGGASSSTGTGRRTPSRHHRGSDPRGRTGNRR